MDIGKSFADRAAGHSRDIDRLNAPLLAGFLLLLAVGGAIAWLVASSQTQSQLVFNAFEVQRSASHLFRIVQSAETGQRGYLLTGDDSYLAPYDAALEAFDRTAQELVDLTRGTPERHVLAIELQKLGREKMAELRKTVALQREGRTGEALAGVKSDDGLKLMEAIRQRVDRIQARATRSINVEYEEGQLLDKSLLLVTLAALVVVLVLGFLVMRSNARAMHTVQDSRRMTEALNNTLEQAVAERTAELLESNEEVQRFAYIVSHDLRAPLVNVMGFTSELETLKSDLIAAGQKPPDDPSRVSVEREFAESIAFIKAAIDKMEGLIAAILRLSREGRRTFRPERIEMTALIEGLADAQRHQIEEAEATVVVDKNLPTLVADRLALEQIFGNLLDNAVKYLDPARPGHIEASGETIGNRARISIRDNGRGIAESDHKRVFELFRRSGEQNRPGDGIGLAHVQTLVRSLGGRITVASELGRGTTFSVVLPLAPKTPSRSDNS